MGHASAPGDASGQSLEHAVREALEHTGHLLPDQAPIRVFIHHNTLHAFQHLHFHEAVVRAREVYGAEPYLAESRYREKLAEGRITVDDLAGALDDQFHGEDAPIAEGLLSQRRLRLLLLEHEIRDETPATLEWLIRERGLLTRLRADVSSEARKRLLESTRQELERALAKGEDGPVRFARLVTGASQAEEARERFEEELALAMTREDITKALADDAEPCCTRALWVACRSRALGYRRELHRRGEHVLLHRDAVLHATGEDEFDRVFPVLIRLAAAYLDDGLAYWPMPERELGFYRATRKLVAEGSALPMRWMEDARRDFRTQLEKSLTPLQVVTEILTELGVDAGHASHYLETLLLTLPGWAGLMSRLERHADDRPPDSVPASLLDFLAVRLTYERAALRDIVRRHVGPSATVASVYAAAQHTHVPSAQAEADTAAYRLFQVAQLAGMSAGMIEQLERTRAHELLRAIDAFDEIARRRVFQEAFERHHRAQILDALAAHRPNTHLGRPKERPRFQVVTCFDEREESFRRQIEEVAPDAETFGAPGFFGAAIRFRGIDEPHHVPLAPVVIKPTHLIEERPRHSDFDMHNVRLERRRRWAKLAHQMHTGTRSLWRGMVLNTALGLLAAFPLLVRIVSPRVAGRIKRFWSDMLLPSPRTELTVHHDTSEDLPGGVSQRGFKADERVVRVATVLENIGFTAPFAKIVFVLGHGSTTLNNPHKSAYDCGACGGRQGGPNARVFCHMANDPEVRQGLAERGFVIPEDTWFVGGQHDTCNDVVTLLDTDRIPESQRAWFEQAYADIQRACGLNAQERCRRLFSAPDDPTPEQALRHVEGRSEHLAEPRPEFGHATNALAVIGRRGVTQGLFLDRRAFVLSYDPSIDADGKILERTLAAATPVGAGISLEYYFSHVDNERYGAGSKLPHNVTGLIGVMSGHASDLRTGLPRQMIEIHEALRLLVIVEATPERLLDIASRQAEVRELVVNRWIQLVSLDPETGAMKVFTDRGFEPYTPKPVTLPEAPTSRDFYLGHSDFLPPARIVGRAA